MRSLKKNPGFIKLKKSRSHLQEELGYQQPLVLVEANHYVDLLGVLPVLEISLRSLMTLSQLSFWMIIINDVVTIIFLDNNNEGNEDRDNWC